MTFTLIRKELHEHGPVLIALVLLTGIGFLLILSYFAVEGEAGSLFVSLQTFLFSFLLFVGLALCNRLVVREYKGRTQLFLEGLPLSRARMISVKFILGFILIAGTVTCAFGLLCLLAWSREGMTLRFFLILAARTYLYTYCLYAFLFMMGLLGRYRITVYLLLILGFVFISNLTDFDFFHFGPVALLFDAFAFERYTFPVHALMVTAGLGLAFTLFALMLALIREGSVAALVAEKMSHREKVFITAMLIGFLFMAFLYGEKTRKEPFDLMSAIEVKREGVLVKMSKGMGQESEARRRLAEKVASEILDLKLYLGLDSVPPVFMTTRRDLDGDRFENGKLEDKEGLLVRINFKSDSWDEKAFLTWLTRELLISRSNGRLKREPKMWVLDGFSLFWARRDKTEASLLKDRQLALRALYGIEKGFSEKDLGQWLLYRERVGGDIAAGVAWSGLKLLEQRQGSHRCRKFLKAVLGRDIPDDVRALFHEWRHHIHVQLRREAGISFHKFLPAWQAALTAIRPALADDLAKIPELQGEVIFENLSSRTRKVRYRININPSPDQTRCAFLYARLPWFDSEVPIHKIRRENLGYSLDHEGEIPETFVQGERLSSTFSLHIETLGCEIISGWKRQAIP